MQRLATLLVGCVLAGACQKKSAPVPPSINPVAVEAGAAGAIARMRGTPQIVHAGVKSAAQAGQALYADDQVMNGGWTSVRATLAGGSELSIGWNSTATLRAQNADHHDTLQLDSGSIWLRLPPAGAEQLPFDLELPTATVTPSRGATAWVTPDAVCALAGELSVRFKASPAPADVHAPHCIVGVNGGRVSVWNPDLEEMAVHLDELITH